MAAQTIRDYERLGLLPRPSREASGYRRHDEAAAARLRFIQSAKLLGLSLAEIGDILQISETQEAPPKAPARVSKRDEDVVSQSAVPASAPSPPP